MASFEPPYLLHIMSASPGKVSSLSTRAAFTPRMGAHATITLDRASPLLAATPPTVARSLAQARPFIVLANRVLGLLTWTSDDPWASFLLVVAFWAVVLYAQLLIQWCGSVVLALLLCSALLRARRMPAAFSLDDVLEELDTLNTRCALVVPPVVDGDNGALGRVGLRVLMLWPLWIAATMTVLPPRRVVLVLGTLLLTHHSIVTRTARSILWRSRAVRRLVSLLTGLDFARATYPAPLPAPGPPLAAMKTRDEQTSTFSYVVWENQRRWLGIGWTSNLFGYERAPWTDDSLQPCAPPEEFVLPAEGPGGYWVWGDKEWTLDGEWVFSDNKWTRPSVKEEFGKYTRRRKWTRLAVFHSQEQEQEQELEDVREEDASLDSH